MVKRLRYVVMLAMLTGATLLPAGIMQASAQGEDLCAGALVHGEGEYAGYEVVSTTGGSGSQIVLGSIDGGSYLSGGSGNDVLCAFGNGNTLDGGSGNDLLVALDGGNVFLGGSGNDTMIGVVGDAFDGGSGRNEVVSRSLGPTIKITFSPAGVGCWVSVDLTGFAANTEYEVNVSRNEILAEVIIPVQTDNNGSGALINIVGYSEEGSAKAEVVGMDGMSTGWVAIAC